MSGIVASEIIVPSALAADERQRLIDDLYLIHCQIFDGVEKASFAKYVVESKANETSILLHKNAAGQVVGYCAVHVFEQKLGARMSAIFRMEAGTLREYRGHNTNAIFGIKSVLGYRLRHPLRRLFYLGTLVHPSSYMMFAKYARQIWPGRDEGVPAEIAGFMGSLSEAFGLQAVDPQRPLVVDVGWKTRDTEAERNYWAACDKPAARFFVQQNPNYSQGRGLMTLVPLDLASIARAVTRVVGERVTRARERSMLITQRLPFVGQRLGARDIQRRLRRADLFAALPPANLAKVAAAAEMMTLSAGSYVFRAGDPGNELFLVASGAVCVLGDQSGEEQIIDQLPTGAMFGEMAMLSGEARTATIRTATKTTLLRVHRSALVALMDSNPTLRQAIWEPFAVRRFNDIVSGTQRFAGLSRRERLDWFERGRQEQLAPGERLDLHGAWCFVLTGAVEIEQAGVWLTLRAPALIEARAPLALIARVMTRIARLPAAPDTLVAPAEGALAVEA